MSAVVEVLPCSGSDLESRSSLGVPFIPEEPPAGLFVEFQYTRGGVMSKYDLWISMTRTIAEIAVDDWNAQIIGSVFFPVTSNVEIIFISSIKPPRYQSKTMIWSLIEVFDFYNDNRHYSNSFIKTTLGTGPGAKNLGVASIKSTLSSTPGLPLNSSAVPALSNETSSVSTTSNRAVDPSSVSDTDLANLQADARGVSVVLSYLVNGLIFSDKGIFKTLLDMLTFAAQRDPKEESSGYLRAYNTPENYTIEIGPTSEAAMENLSWTNVILALAYLPRVMLQHRPTGRWAELSGRIKLSGAFIGKILIIKGDHRDGRDSRGGSCVSIASDSGVSNGGTDTSLEKV